MALPTKTTAKERMEMGEHLGRLREDQLVETVRRIVQEELDKAMAKLEVRLAAQADQA